MNNNLITVDALDFDGIKQNIKTFLSGQTTLTDYNFEGSVLSTLIDVLAYNTHYNSLYTNLMLNESFIDSASKYSSVVSLAKSIGYVSKSTKSSKSKVIIRITDVASPPPALTLPALTSFRGVLDDKDYSYHTTEASTASLVSGGYEYEVTLTEGIPVTNVYQNIPGATFVIQNANVDLSTLKVAVQTNSGSSEFTTFYRVGDLLSITGKDNVYFIKQREDLLYEVYFGNDVIGKALVAGNVVYLDYLVSSGQVTNGCGKFYYSGGFRGDALYQVTTIENAIGGADRESIESIKFNAPRAYTSQNRAVTADDYRVQITGNFPQVETLSVWGGQDNVPRKYGVVFISAKPYGRKLLNDQEKTEIAKFLDAHKSVMTVQHEFVDPTVLDISVVSNVYYSPNLTNKSEGDLRALVTGAISSYASQLNVFGKSFRFSAMSKMIDDSDKSIISNITTIKLSKTETVFYGVAYKYRFVLGNPIHSDTGAVVSTKFYVPEYSHPCFLYSAQNGDLDLYGYFSDNSASRLKTVGKVNFTTGEVLANALLISAMFDTEFRFDIVPASNDVIPVRDHILTLPLNKLAINMIADTGNAEHIFSYSR